MRDADPRGLTYEVVTDELTRAAACVEAVTDVARDATDESLPTSAESMGDAAVAGALAQFCARWDAGLSHLVGDSDEMAQRLRATADAYERAECSAVATYERLRSGNGPALSASPLRLAATPPVWPDGG